MPIIKSAIKRMKQNQVNRNRNRHYRSNMKSMIKLLLTYVQKGEMDKAKKILPDVVRSIDMAAKKKILHENNAAHKKSKVQRAINAGPPKKEEKPVKEKAPKKAKATKKKEEKAEAKEEVTKEAKKDE
jgi:small subunit ribosomal protein S20